jgi:copper homeostasis protein
MEAAPNCRFTFHRAFDEVAEPVSVLQRLKAFPQVDRVLTSGGKGDWSERKQRLIEWQRAASPEITLLIGAGLSKQVLTDLARCPELTEVHIGRAARLGHSTNGRVARQAVQELRTILQ